MTETKVKITHCTIKTRLVQEKTRQALATWKARKASSKRSRMQEEEGNEPWECEQWELFSLLDQIDEIRKVIADCDRMVSSPSLCGHLGCRNLDLYPALADLMRRAARAADATIKKFPDDGPSITLSGCRCEKRGGK